MTQNYDAFDDVIRQVTGIFGEEQAALDPALKKHDSVRAEVRQEGVVLQFSCQGCGRSTQLCVEWPEILAIKYGKNPQLAYQRMPQVVQEPTRWEYLPQEYAWRPHLKCPNCPYWFPIRINPNEPERYLQSARRRGFINPQGEQYLAQICAQAPGPAGR